jgi:hypothetical protein
MFSAKFILFNKEIEPYPSSHKYMKH